jgi:TIR domain
MPAQVFISYARVDNVSPPDDAKAQGFVTFLKGQLLFEFDRLGHPVPDLWMDLEEIESAQQFGSRIPDALAASSLLVVVTSRNWLERPWCRKEFETFAEQRKVEAEIVLRERIVVVSLHDIPEENIPPLLRGQEGYRFFSPGPRRKPGTEEPFFDRGEIKDPRFKKRVRDLAKYLWTQAQGVAPSPPERAAAIAAPAPSTTQPPLRTVYLAKPATDMQQPYFRLVEELGRRRFNIVPPVTETIPMAAPAAVQFIDDALSNADVSIHLLGAGLGYSPEGADPIVKLQLVRAALDDERRKSENAAAGPSLRRLIWAPKIFENNKDGKQVSTERDPLAVLTSITPRLDSDKTEGDSLSKFVDFVLQHLESSTPPITIPAWIPEDTHVYVHHRPEDANYALQVAMALQELKVYPVLPALEGDAAELAAFHQQNLRDCEAVVLCWAAASEVWVRATARELGEWRKLGRTAQFACRGLVAGPPPGERKSFLVKLPPRNEIDVVIDLTAKPVPCPDILQTLIRKTQTRQA